MPGNKLSLSSVEEAEIVFYEAFRNCDAQVLAALWSDANPVCVHPGSGIIEGYEAVMRSWQHIFKNAQPPELEYEVVQRTESDGLSVHLVIERLGDSRDPVYILATNVYQKQEAGWMMLSHHASVVSRETAFMQPSQTLQ